MANEPILIIEDDDAIREFITMSLSDEGYQVLNANDGSEGFEIIKRQPLSLVILDMRMPVMDGWTFLSKYKELPSPRAPVIAASANNRAVSKAPDDVVAFVAKPFDLDELITLVNKYAQPARTNQ